MREGLDPPWSLGGSATNHGSIPNQLCNLSFSHDNATFRHGNAYPSFFLLCGVMRNIPSKRRRVEVAGNWYCKKKKKNYGFLVKTEDVDGVYKKWGQIVRW